jgi:hypothetical protein
MAKLPKAIIKKYGITKKAWSVFRGSKVKTKRVYAKVKTMARRRYGFKKHHRSSGNGGVSAMKIGISAAAYGAFRDQIHSMIPNVGVPYSDSLITGAIGYYLSGKKGWMKNAGIAILAVEAAAVGKTLISGNTGSSQVNLSTY